MLLLLNLAYNPPAQKLQFTLFLKTSLICLAVHCTRLNCILIKFRQYIYLIHCTFSVYTVKCSFSKQYNMMYDVPELNCTIILIVHYLYHVHSTYIVQLFTVQKLYVVQYLPQSSTSTIPAAARPKNRMQTKNFMFIYSYINSYKKFHYDIATLQINN